MKRRLAYVGAALATIAVGLRVHRGTVALPNAVRDAAGDALWAAMVYWWVGAGWPGASAGRRAGAALGIAWAVEFSQCYHAPGIDAVRATTLGHLVLGSDFDLRDLLAYAVGVGAAYGAEWGARGSRSGGVRLRSSGDAAGVERASAPLIAAVARRRTLVIVEAGSDAERYLDALGAEANVGGRNTDHILARPNPSKAALLEEFLHGTQRQIGLIDETNLAAAEYHVKDFMIRHRRLLGLGDEDVRRLTLLRDAGL